MGIDVVDHLILADHRYYSFRETGGLAAAEQRPAARRAASAAALQGLVQTSSTSTASPACRATCCSAPASTPACRSTPCATRSAAWRSTTTRSTRDACCAPASRRRSSCWTRRAAAPPVPRATSMRTRIAPASTHGMRTQAHAPTQPARPGMRTTHALAHAPSRPRGTPHAHRTLAEIEALIARSALAGVAQSRAVALFRRLAEAEAAIHECRSSAFTCTRSAPSTRSSTSSAACSRWSGSAPIAIVASPLNVGSGMVAVRARPVPGPGAGDGAAAAGRARSTRPDRPWS